MRVLEFLCVGLLCAASLNAQAQTAIQSDKQAVVPPVTGSSKQSGIESDKERDIRHLLEVTGATGRMQAIMTRMEQTIKPLMENSFPPGEYRARLINDFFVKLHSRMDLQPLVDAAAAAYARHFTLQEVKELLRFYETPVGKKSITVMPELTQELMDIGQQWGEETGRKCMLEVFAEHPEYEKAIEEAKKAQQ